MNQTSPAATGTTGIAITALVALLSVFNDHFGWKITPDELAAIAGGIPVAVHWLAQQYAARAAAKAISNAIPPAPAQS